MFEPPLTETQKKQGAVLARAHALLMADNTMKVGTAIKRAVEAADVEVPQDVQDGMVRALGKLLFQGFPSKVDA